MALQVSVSNNKKIYNLTQNKTFEDYLALHKENLKKMKKDSNFLRRLELIQGFEFPSASTTLKITPDKNHIIVSGIYGPLLKIFDTNELTLKCLRGLDSEIVDFEILGEDYRKIACVCADRFIEIQAQYGKHYKTRVPKSPRCIFYNKFSSDLLVGCSSSSVYRLNLEEGRFMSSIETTQIGVNSIIFNKFLDLSLFGCDKGVIDICDNRQSKNIGQLVLEDKDNVTLVKQSLNPFEFYLGSEEGLIRLYDLRCNKFLSEKRHPYMMPIKSIEFHEAAHKIITVDKKQIRIAELNDLSEIFLTYEPKDETNDVKVFGNSGLLLSANESQRCGLMFIPALGPAPNFCSFLENFTEELDEKPKNIINEDFQFISFDELKTLNANHLIGTDKLKSHLHGFLIKKNLYESLKAVT